MAELTEKRSRLRIDYEAAITICPEGLEPIEGQCSNVSMDGIFVKTESVLKVGTACAAKIVLQGPNSTLTIDIDGVVSRAEDGAVAVQFRDNLEWWAIFTIYAQYSGNIPMDGSICCPEKVK